MGIALHRQGVGSGDVVARDQPGIIEALVRGIFDAMVELRDQGARQELAGLMSKGYNIPAPDALAMQGDA
ncbi:MAG: hypothetical protein ACKOFW_17200, partial [Planctomycetaceae bacterium]